MWAGATLIFILLERGGVEVIEAWLDKPLTSMTIRHALVLLAALVVFLWGWK